MSKTNASRAFTVSAVALDVFVASVWHAADVVSDLRDAFQEADKAGVPLDELKRAFRDAWVARILSKGGALTEKALFEGKRVNDLKGIDAKVAPDLKRNAEQERAYTAAKVALTGLTKSLGIVSGREGAGGRKPRQTEGKADETAAPSTVQEAVPVFANSAEADAYMARMAALLDMTARRNAEHFRAARLAPILTGFKAYSAD